MARDPMATVPFASSMVESPARMQILPSGFYRGEHVAERHDGTRREVGAFGGVCEF